MKTESAVTGWLAVWLTTIVVGVVVPTIIGILIGRTPNYLVRSADAGQFVSATTSVGGFFAPDVTSVQTTRGSISVQGQFSAERGQAMQVTERLKDGLQLCASGRPPVCASLSGPWAGLMQRASHPYYRFAPLATTIGAGGVTVWLALGVLTTLVIPVVMSDGIDPERPEDETSD